MHFAAPQRTGDIGSSKMPIKEKIVHCTKNFGQANAAAAAGLQSRPITHSNFS
jgi:hypothetical protein